MGRFGRPEEIAAAVLFFAAHLRATSPARASPWTAGGRSRCDATRESDRRRARFAVGGEYLDNVDPATGLVVSEVPCSDQADVDAAVAAAEAAFPQWSRAPAAERSRYLTESRI